MKAKHVIGGLALIGVGAAAATAAILNAQKKEQEALCQDDAILLDLDGDGVPDVILEDLDGDTKIDTVTADTTGDGHMDTILRDTTGDGNVNVVLTENPELLGETPEKPEADPSEQA